MLLCGYLQEFPVGVDTLYEYLFTESDFYKRVQKARRTKGVFGYFAYPSLVFLQLSSISIFPTDGGNSSMDPLTTH